MCKQELPAPWGYAPPRHLTRAMRTKLTEIAGGVVVVDARSGGGERRALWAGQWYTNQLQEGLRNIRA